MRFKLTATESEDGSSLLYPVCVLAPLLLGPHG